MKKSKLQRQGSIKSFRFLLIPILFFSIINPITCRAQTPPSDTLIFKVTMNDGNIFVGKKIEDTAEYLVLESPVYGRVELPKNEIKKINPIRSYEIQNGEYVETHLQDARYYWAPNGYGLRQGEGYYQNIWVFFNQFSYGFSDHFSVGLGIVPLFLLSSDVTPVWITPKFSIPVVKDKLNIGLGVLSGVLLGELQSGFGIFYGEVTLGSRENNLSFGMGYGYSGGGLGNDPIYNLSGMYKVSSRGYIMTENYIFPDNFGLISGGGRTVWPNISLDYALVIPTNIGETIAFPIIGFVIPFN